MNAPTTIKAARCDRSAGVSGGGPAFEGVARHVCVDGCQFVVTGAVPEVGRRLSFVVGSGVAISGSVSWVIADRIGFGFDRQIGPETMSVLSAHVRAPSVVQLLPCLAPGDRRPAQD